MDLATSRKWDSAARTFDLMSAWGPERRWRPAKRRLFAAMRGKVLFLAVGTGLDIPHFPPGRDIVAIDISERMLERARARAAAYPGRIELRRLDVHDLDYPAATFDQVFTSCTFCSVPEPIAALQRLRGVLKPGGDLYMFEHTRSRYFPFGLMLSAMTPLSQRLGPALNRPTERNVEHAGFRIVAVENIYLDVVKTIHAVAPP